MSCNGTPQACCDPFDDGHYKAIDSLRNGARSKNKDVRGKHYSYDDCWKKEQEAATLDNIIESPVDFRNEY